MSKQSKKHNASTTITLDAEELCELIADSLLYLKQQGEEGINLENYLGGVMIGITYMRRVIHAQIPHADVENTRDTFQQKVQIFDSAIHASMKG